MSQPTAEVEPAEHYPRRSSVSPLEEWRCWSCRRLIARVALAPGSVITIKCRCNQANTRQVIPMLTENNPADE